ncbi:hypothetical protein CPB84DRAFT_1743382 [Gymnopilus junonius]|uniref:Uncharacterized protein n=1 Tax=Gymnopilus junonius TaxID=109634 RepID=A0A9P5TSF7_GYMJU|nr:hypothetical protein CPB84DRAFT_1743382 [Gymnopilus junonius]
MKISDTAVEIILAGGEQVITGETVRQVEFLWTSMARLSTLEELILKRDLRRQVGRKVYSFILPRLKVEFSEHLSLLKDWIAAHKHYLERWNWKLDAEHDENFEGLRQKIRGMVQNCSGIEDLLTGVIDRDLPASNNVLDQLIKSMERTSNKVNHVLADERKLARLDAMREASDSDLRRQYYSVL